MSKARDLAQKPNQPTGRKNLIINGAQVIDQRNSGSSVTITSNPTYITDRFEASMPSGGGSKMSVQQVSEAPAGFEYSLKVTSLTADTVAAGDFYAIDQWIEGQNCSFLNWGSSDAKTVTLSFYVRSSLTGTFGGALQNNGRTRAYPFTYTISSANTWERKTITISGDTSGTWLTTNGRGIAVIWGISVGSTFLGTAGAWVGANKWSASSTTSVLETNAATWQVTGVQFEVGSTATEFEHCSYGDELQLCQRYYVRYPSQEDASTFLYYAQGMIYNTTTIYYTIHLPVPMRVNPDLEIRGTADFTSVDSGTIRNLTNLTMIGDGFIGNKVVSLAGTGSSLTANRPSILRGDGTSGGFIAFEAEL